MRRQFWSGPHISLHLHWHKPHTVQLHKDRDCDLRRGSLTPKLQSHTEVLSSSLSHQTILPNGRKPISNCSYKSLDRLMSHLDERPHAKLNCDILCGRGVGDVARLLEVVLTLLLLLALVLGHVGRVTLLVVAVVALLHLVVLNLFHCLNLVNAPLLGGGNLSEGRAGQWLSCLEGVLGPQPLDGHLAPAGRLGSPCLHDNCRRRCRCWCWHWKRNRSRKRSWCGTSTDISATVEAAKGFNDQS